MNINSYSFHTNEVEAYVYAFYPERGLKKKNISHDYFCSAAVTVFICNQIKMRITP